MERVCVYSRRVAGMIASLAVLGVAGLCIVALTIYSSSLESDIAETQLAAFAAFIVRGYGSTCTWRSSYRFFVCAQVPVCVTLINAIQPVVIIKIAKLEKWDDPGQQVKYTVWRLFVAKLVNVLLQVRTESRAMCNWCLLFSQLRVAITGDILLPPCRSTFASRSLFWH